MSDERRMGTDSFYLDGDDIEAVRAAMELKKLEVIEAGGSILHEDFTLKRGGDREVAEARFDYEMPLGELADEVEFDPRDVEDPQGDTSIEEIERTNPGV